MTTIEERKNCEAARFHVEMSQGIITRMASNSSNCKNWCITVITAILAQYEVLNYFINGSTNASAEPINAKMKGFRSEIHGIQDLPFFLFRCTKMSVFP